MAKDMKVIAGFSVVPIGVGASLTEYVAACERVLDEAGLEHTLHANGTNVEGDWDAVMAAVKRCHEVVHGMGAPRVSTNLYIGTRTDREQSLADKIESVQKELRSQNG